MTKRRYTVPRDRKHKLYTPADNEAAKEQMLKVSYDDIKREFLEAVAESHEPKCKAEHVQ